MSTPEAYNELLNQNKELFKNAASSFGDYEHIFIKLIDSLEDAFWFSVGNKVVYINPVFEKIWGISCEDIYLNPNILTDLIHIDDKQRVMNILSKEQLGDESLLNYDYRILRLDKTIRWVRAKSVSVFNENNRIINIGVTRDITQEKETALRLLQSENTFRMLFENMPTGVAIYKCLDNGEHFVIVNFNKAAEEITLTKRENVINKHLLEVFPNMGNSPLFKALQEVERTGEELHLKPFYYKDDKREGWRENHLYKLSTGEIIAIFDDVTDRENANILLKKQNLELLEAKRRAEESNSLKTEFLNNMSHEIRTPMNGIIGFSELLNNPDITDQERSLFSKTVQNSSYQLLRIIDDILEISTLETKQKQIVETEFDLNELLEELLAIFNLKRTIGDVSLNFKKSLPNSQSRIILDKTKLNKILSNIIENALRYTEKGFVEIGYYLEANNIVLYVKDSGIGISPENHSMVFERFSQEDKDLSRKYGGLGLGLAISKESARLMGGDITLESVKGKGSTFFIILPYKPAAIKKVLDNDPIRIEPASKSKLYTILIAEDEEVNFLYIEQVLKLESTFNYTLIHAKNGKEALEFCLHNNEIDLVLMDIKMSLMNGHEATKEIKLIYPNLPIIAQTAYSTGYDRQLALQSGCDNFISKPINKERLFELLYDYLKIE